jgi:hypothetical protein
MSRNGSFSISAPSIETCSRCRQMVQDRGILAPKFLLPIHENVACDFELTHCPSHSLVKQGVVPTSPGHFENGSVIGVSFNSNEMRAGRCPCRIASDRWALGCYGLPGQSGGAAWSYGRAKFGVWCHFRVTSDEFLVLRNLTQEI